jgi:uncharacterized Tic20 family protein
VYCPYCGAKIASVKEAKIDQDKHKKKKESAVDEWASINQRIKVKNNQQTTVNKLLIAAGIFAILTVLPFMEWSPVSRAWALAFISFFLCICSLVIAWMFRGRSKKLQSLITGENLLAEWTLSPEMKERYIHYFFHEERGKNFAVLTVISVMAVIIFGLFILFIDEGKLFMLGVLAALILFLSLFAFGMPYYYRYTNRKGDGKVLIGAKYAYVNGYFHNWDFPLSGLSKVKVMKKPFCGINLVYYYADRTLRHSEALFIPANEDMDLESLVESTKELNVKKRKKR